MANITVSEGPYIFNFKPVVGDTLTRTITFYEGDPLALADITGDTFRMVVEYKDTKEIVHDLAIGSGMAFEGDNTVRWTLTDAETATWEIPRQMTYAIIRTKADGTVRTIQAGTITPQKFQTN